MSVKSIEKSDNPEIQFLLDAFAKQQAEIKQLKEANSKKDEIIAKQQADIDKLKAGDAKQQADIAFLQRTALDTRNKFRNVRIATSGIYQLTLGMFKRLLSRANGVDEKTFNIVECFKYEEIWCAECLEKFDTSTCKNYTGSAPTCPACLPTIKLEKLHLQAHGNLKIFAGPYEKTTRKNVRMTKVPQVEYHQSPDAYDD